MQRSAEYVPLREGGICAGVGYFLEGLQFLSVHYLLLTSTACVLLTSDPALCVINFSPLHFMYYALLTSVLFVVLPPDPCPLCIIYFRPLPTVSCPLNIVGVLNL